MNNLRKKTFTVLITFAALSSVVLVAWILLLYKTNSIHYSYLDLAKQLEEVETEGQSAQSLRSSLRETDKGREKIETLFVDEDNVIDFLSRIESVGEVSGADVDLISFQEENGSLVLNLEVRGKFSSIFDFTKLVELLPYKVSIQSLNTRYRGDVIEGEKTLKSQWLGSYVLSLESFLVSENNEE